VAVLCDRIWCQLAGAVTPTKEAQEIGNPGSGSRRFTASIEQPELKHGCSRIHARTYAKDGLLEGALMEGNLTTEQEYLLKRVAIEAVELSRDGLIEALLACWEARLRQKQFFLEQSRSAGFIFKMEEGATLYAPETDEDFEEVFGYCPTPEEAEEYMCSLWENATMELDMDAIVLESED
jgi:hypothetical protein